MQHADVWRYRESAWAGVDLEGFDVEADDGAVGRIDEATRVTGSSYLVVDAGTWIVGKKTLLPAGLIDRIDRNDRRVYVNRSRHEIECAPAFDEARYDETTYLAEVGAYYGQPSPGGTFRT